MVRKEQTFSEDYIKTYNYPRPSELKILRDSHDREVATAALRLQDAHMNCLSETERKPYLVAITSALRELRS